LAQEMDSYVIAEGIEDPADLQVLKDLGIVYVQGYLFCRPVRFNQIAKMQKSGVFCACSLESRKETSPCVLEGLGLCSQTNEPSRPKKPPVRSISSGEHYRRSEVPALTR